MPGELLLGPYAPVGAKGNYDDECDDDEDDDDGDDDDNSVVDDDDEGPGSGCLEGSCRRPMLQ